MVLEIPGGIFGQSDVRETPSSTQSNAVTIVAPIGSILPWLKSYTNTPQTLPTGWLECNGALLSDADSVFNGQYLPDLNGGEFIRGFTTSGGTGGSDTMAHTHGVTTNVTVANHTALAMGNHTALAISNHTALALNTENAHTHGLSAGFGKFENAGTDVLYTEISTASWTPTTQLGVSSSGAYSTARTEGMGLGGSTDAGSAHTHSFSTNISAHSFSQNISAHSFSQNISNHSVTNNAVTSDAASNTENRPLYYNVVWIIRVK